MHKLIAHALIKSDGKYLVIKRSEIKRGNLNIYPEYWDIPGGSVEENELPRDAAIRETLEEVNLDICVSNIIYEDSNLDTEKNMIFTRLVYEAIIKDFCNEIILDKEEHSEYCFIKSLAELENQNVVPYLSQIIK